MKHKLDPAFALGWNMVHSVVDLLHYYCKQLQSSTVLNLQADAVVHLHSALIYTEAVPACFLFVVGNGGGVVDGG